MERLLLEHEALQIRLSGLHWGHLHLLLLALEVSNQELFVPSAPPSSPEELGLEDRFPVWWRGLGSPLWQGGSFDWQSEEKGLEAQETPGVRLRLLWISHWAPS